MLRFFFRRKESHSGVLVDGVCNNEETKIAYHEYVNNYREKFSEILKGNQLAWLNSFFMSPPAFPIVNVAYKKNYLFKLRKGGTSKYRGARIDFYTNNEDKGCASVRLGGIKLLVYYSLGWVVVETEGIKKKLRANKGNFSLNILKINSTKMIWVSGNKNSLLCESWDGEWPFESFSIKDGSGTLGIASVQCWSDKASNYWSALDIGGARVADLKSSPYWVREWEEKSRKLWHISIALRVCADYLLKNKKYHNSSDPLAAYVICLAELIFTALSHFSHWRPSSSVSAKKGEWERGNWASGFLCGAFGLSAGILHDLNLLKKSKRNISEIIIKRGGAWLVRDSSTPYTNVDFPPVAHWIRRSTNHGIVILSSALVGLEEVCRISKDNHLQDSIYKIRSDFWELINKSFKDGVYLEGVRYAQFSLQEAITYIIYSHRKSVLAWNVFIEENFPVAPLVKGFICAASYPGSNVPYVSWGDCPILPWKSSVIHFLDSIERQENDEKLHLKVFHRLGNIKLHPKESNEILKTEPLTLPTKLLPKSQKTTNSKIDQAEIWSNSIGVINKRKNSFGYADWKLYVISTPVHLTHNKDHDIGSFYWAVNGELCVGEIAGRAAHAHSSVAVKGSMLENDINPYSCYGGEAEKKLLDRNYHGTVESVGDEHEGYQRLRVSAKGGILFHDGIPQIENFERDFIVVGFQEPVLLVITRGTALKKNAFINFVCPNGAGAIEGEASSPINQYSLAGKHATLRIVGNDHSFVSVDEKQNAINKVIVDMEGKKDFCNISILESSQKKCQVEVFYRENNEVSMVLSSAEGFKIKVAIPNVGSQINIEATD